MGGLLGSVLHAAQDDAGGGSGRGTVAPRNHHRRDLRPVFADAPGGDRGSGGGGGGAAVHPVVDPSRIIADLENDREEREAEEEADEVPPHGGAFEQPDSDLPPSDMSGGRATTNNAARAATAGADDDGAAGAAGAAGGASWEQDAVDSLPDTDGPTSADSSSPHDTPEEVSSTSSPDEHAVVCHNHLRAHHCEKMVARTGCEQWVKMESPKKIVRLLARGLIAHHGAFLVRDLCSRLCGGCAQQAGTVANSDLSDDGSGNFPGGVSSPANDGATNKKAKGFGGIFDIVGNLFRSSKTSPASEGDASVSSHPDDADDASTSPTDAQAPTGDRKKDGWWSGLEAAVSDADHVVIEHRHLFEAACLVLLLLMGTALCVWCCCCYAGKTRQRRRLRWQQR